MRIYLAAPTTFMLGEEARGATAVDVKRALISYTGGSTARFVRAFDRLGEPSDVCIDSGAHGFQNKHFKKKQVVTVEEVERHIDRMAAMIEALVRVGARPRFFVEMDLQRIFGYDQVLKWRANRLRPIEDRLGVPLCYVWHRQDGPEAWRALLDDSKVKQLAVSMPACEWIAKTRAPLVYQAHEARKPVHGFACVRPDLVSNVPLTTVDSTSWSSAGVYGSSMSFDVTTGKLRVVAHNRSRSYATRAGRLLQYTRGAQHTDVGTRQLEALMSRAVVEYELMERYYTEFWRQKGVVWDE